MQHPLSLIAKATGVAAVCLLAYNGFQLYSKNNITIYVTEVVHLPETMAVRRSHRRRTPADPGLPLTIEGKVEMETCLMNSYRFLLKLVGHVRTAFPDSGKSTAMSPRSARHRVLSLQTSSSYNTFRDDDSVSNASVTGKGKHGPSLLITAVDPVVDAFEAESSGLLTFTPACIGEGLLCRYTCTAGTAEEKSNGAPQDVCGSASGYERGNSASTSTLASPAPYSVLPGGDNGLGSLYVRSCFLESDGETAYCQRLTMEIEFIRPVLGVRVVVRLPSKHCRLQRSSTGGIGTVTQLLHQPRKFVWDIGEVTEAMCAVPPEDALTGGAAAVEEMMPGAFVQASDTSCARLELVFEQPPPGISFGEEEDAYPDDESDDDDDEDENRFGSSVSSAKTGSSKRHTRSVSESRRRSGGNSGVSPTSAAAAAAAGSTGRSRKREERARKAAEKAARILEGRSGADGHARSAVGDDAPTVEIVFSVNQLLSGTAVKKLQVLQESPNWTPRSRLDHLVLRRLLPSLEKMKLKKLAHYTTWFVQPVAVSRL
jgi:hypothetical protein